VCLTVVGSGGAQAALGCRTITATNRVVRSSTVTRYGSSIVVRGWAVDSRTAFPVHVTVTANGRTVASLTANAAAPVPTGTWSAWGAGHGFTRSFRSASPVTVCVAAADAAHPTPNRSCVSR
jgi:hypothetical protein